jgi:hypothetical protein
VLRHALKRGLSWRSGVAAIVRFPPNANPRCPKSHDFRDPCSLESPSVRVNSAGTRGPRKLGDGSQSSSGNAFALRTSCRPRPLQEFCDPPRKFSIGVYSVPCVRSTALERGNGETDSLTATASPRAACVWPATGRCEDRYACLPTFVKLCSAGKCDSNSPGFLSSASRGRRKTGGR